MREAIRARGEPMSPSRHRDGKKAAVNIDKYLGGSGELNMGEWLEIPVIPDMEVTEPHMRFPV